MGTVPPCVFGANLFDTLPSNGNTPQARNGPAELNEFAEVVMAPNAHAKTVEVADIAAELAFNSGEIDKTRVGFDQIWSDLEQTCA